jgi:hypothetical protein
MDFDDIPLMGYLVSEAPMMPTTEELIAQNEWKKMIQAYLACISFVDAQVGKSKLMLLRIQDTLKIQWWCFGRIMVIILEKRTGWPSKHYGSVIRELY